MFFLSLLQTYYAPWITLTLLLMLLIVPLR